MPTCWQVWYPVSRCRTFADIRAPVHRTQSRSISDDNLSKSFRTHKHTFYRSLTEKLLYAQAYTYKLPLRRWQYIFLHACNGNNDCVTELNDRNWERGNTCNARLVSGGVDRSSNILPVVVFIFAICISLLLLLLLFITPKQQNHTIQ